MNLNAHIRSFSHALQFLTRLPAPPIGVFDPADLSRSALWFPVVGAIVGASSPPRCGPARSPRRGSARCLRSSLGFG